MEEHCNNGSYIWKNILENSESPEYINNIKEIIFNLYKKRPLATPIQSIEMLFEYYPCNMTILCSEESSTDILGGVMWWQTPYGNKLSTSFSSNNDVYKNEIIPKYKELLETDGYYAELSEALEYLLIKNYNFTNIKDVDTIINVLDPYVQREDILMTGDPRLEEHRIKNGTLPCPTFSYLRNIRGVGIERKALYGKPCMSKKFIGEGCNKTCVHNYEPYPNNTGGLLNKSRKSNKYLKRSKRSKRSKRNKRRSKRNKKSKRKM